MSPLQVAKLAIDWHQANGADVEEVIRQTAASYAFTDSETAHAMDLANQQLARRQVLGYWPTWAMGD